MDTSIRGSYAELRCKSGYSFLTGASHPHELVEQAHALGLVGLAITDRNGVYGMPKAYRASKQYSGFKLIVGAELTIENKPPITFLARDRQAYGVLCRMITTAHANKPKGDACLAWAEVVEYLQRPAALGLVALCDDGTGVDYSTLKQLLGDRLYLPLLRLLDGHDQKRTARTLDLARQYDCKIVATNDVHYHAPNRRVLQDVMTSIRKGTTLKVAGRQLFSNAERYLKSPQQMMRLFKDQPQALRHTLEIAESCVFSPNELRYFYPSEWIPAGETAQGYLTKLVWEGAIKRYPDGIPSRVVEQIEYELKLIAELGFADYFLTIWEIVEFARSRDILCQGRGSAANSVICYCLGITAIDPVRMNLLFERFLSAERGEPPDIDVDFEHERREEVIQHIYEKYGRDRAAMVAAVITYRSRSASREVSKVLEVDLEKFRASEAIERRQRRRSSTNDGTPLENLAHKIADEIYGFPRHLSIHSGGFTLSRDPIIETVPVEPARMPGRTIIQWDKDDLDAIGLLKIDVLALGMLTAIHKACNLAGLEYSTLPSEDPQTYAMIQKADTVGTFQIESRAQINMLGRLQPENFYDLVVQVAIVRPGPIVGKMVHPYLKRRRGLEKADVPHPLLRPILDKTLGVPIFQEQVMKIAIVLGGFTPGEADELRRAIGAWRSSGSIEKMGHKLMQGLLKSGLPREWVERLFMQIKGFAEYGFPESHAASFALIAYASSYLKCHHPAEFCCGLLNSQPMGFYSPHSLVDDAKRHGVRILPVHPAQSKWDNEVVYLEGVSPEGTVTARKPALRLGWRSVKGLGWAEAECLLKERSERPFSSLTDFLSRVKLKSLVLQRLAMGDSFSCFGYDQRHALWEVLSHSGQDDLFSALEPNALQLCLFETLDDYAAIRSDYRSFGLSARGHPMQALRARLTRLPKLTTAAAKKTRHGEAVSLAGLVIVRQRPPTAAGTMFLALEDETGFVDLILHKNVQEKYDELILTHSFLIAHGIAQRDRDSMSLLVKQLRPIYRNDEIVQPSFHGGDERQNSYDGESVRIVRATVPMVGTGL